MQKVSELKRDSKMKEFDDEQNRIDEIRKKHSSALYTKSSIADIEPRQTDYETDENFNLERRSLIQAAYNTVNGEELDGFNHKSSAESL
jgi:hypothetical protein